MNKKKQLIDKYKDLTPYITVKYKLNGIEKIDTLKFELFWRDTPTTALNFAALIDGYTTESGKVLKYEESKFHRIIPRFVLQGGDFTKGDGRGGMSIYGRSFDDENFIYKHERGVLSMANAGPNTNGSQFFITFAAQSYLDGKHVVFGRLLDRESMDALSRLEAIETQSTVPKESVIIQKAGFVSKVEHNNEKVL